jgi:hypothetical protein
MDNNDIEYHLIIAMGQATLGMPSFDRKAGKYIQHDEAAFLDAINSKSPRKIAEMLAHLQASILTLHDLVTAKETNP